MVEKGKRGLTICVNVRYWKKERIEVLSGAQMDLGQIKEPTLDISLGQ